MDEFVWILSSVFLISLTSFVGVFFLVFQKDVIQKYLFFLVALSAGTLLGDALIHLLPEALETADSSLSVSFGVLSGFIAFFVLEKFLHWHHHHSATHSGENEKSFGYLNLFGDALHNFLDGVLIATSYFISIPIGIATTVAVFLHELPQEISDFGVLIAAGFGKKKAFFFNFLSALCAVLGALTVIVLTNFVTMSFQIILISFTAGGFIYIAATDLLPELNKQKNFSNAMLELAFFAVGIMAMIALIAIE